MAEQWTIEEPRVLDVGGEGERVRALKVGLVGGRVDVVTHDDSPAARIEVSDVKGQPVLVRWDGSTLKISQGRDSESGIVDRLRATFEGIEHNRVVISVSIPDDATATVSTVSADALVAGVHAEVKANTVSGALERQHRQRHRRVQPAARPAARQLRVGHRHRAEQRAA
jgi:hypothetical protein